MRKNRGAVGGGTKVSLINEGSLANNDAIITIPRFINIYR